MVTPFLPSAGAVNAGELVMFRQVQKLAERHQVTLVSFADGGSDSRPAVDALHDFGIDVRVTERPPLTGPQRLRRRPGLAVRWLRGDRPLQVLDFQSATMQRLIDRVTQEVDPDLIQVEYSWMGGYRYPARTPTLLTEHEVGLIPAREALIRAHQNPQPLLSLRAAADYARWNRYELAVCRRFSRVQVFTNRDREVLLRYLPELHPRLRVNPFGMDLPRPADPRTEDPRALVFVGGFVHPPNVDAALWLGREIMPRLRRAVPDCHLWIVGSNPPDDVVALAGEDITVTGRVAAVEPFLARAAVVVAPLRLGGGMRFKVLQAMAMGRPVVTTALGAAGIGGPHRPPLVVASGAADFTSATAELFADPARRRKLGTAARACVALHHGWDGYLDRLERTYSEILIERRRSQRTALR
jgi:glycosyltransferase involved in cell wall biosynthesis